MNQVLMPNWPAVLVVAVLVALAILVAWGVWEWWITRRNVRQIEGADLMLRGFKAAERLGWLPDDLQ